MEGSIKVSDFGLSTGLYEKMYFRQEKSDSVKLPIKWMALESIEDGVFSEKSDVVSTNVHQTIINLITFLISGHLVLLAGRSSAEGRLRLVVLFLSVFLSYSWRVIGWKDHTTLLVPIKRKLLL